MHLQILYNIGSSIVNTLGNIKFGDAVRKNNAIKIHKLVDVFDIMPFNADKSAMTSRTEDLDFVEVYLQLFVCLLFQSRSHFAKAHDSVSEQPLLDHELRILPQNDPKDADMVNPVELFFDAFYDNFTYYLCNGRKPANVPQLLHSRREFFFGITAIISFFHSMGMILHSWG